MHSARETGSKATITKADYLEASRIAKEAAMKVEFKSLGCSKIEIPNVFGNKWREAFCQVREQFSENTGYLDDLFVLADREYVYACQWNATFLNLQLQHSAELFDDEDKCLFTPEGYANNTGWAEVLYEGLNSITKPAELYFGFCCNKPPEQRDILLAKALFWFFEAADLFATSKTEALDLLYEAGQALALAEGRLMWRASSDCESDKRREIATRAADTLHSKPGGSREKKQLIKDAWASGKYSSRDVCAEEECAGIGMACGVARKALINTPNPKPWPAKPARN